MHEGPPHQVKPKSLAGHLGVMVDSGSYCYPYVVDRPVPQHEEWAKSHPGRGHR